jgi:hypothetical protein
MGRTQTINDVEQTWLGVGAHLALPYTTCGLVAWTTGTARPPILNVRIVGHEPMCRGRCRDQFPRRIPNDALVCRGKVLAAKGLFKSKQEWPSIDAIERARGVAVLNIIRNLSWCESRER